MRTSTLVLCLCGLCGALAAGCTEPDLGDVPFFCNNGDPKCPDGYECVAGRCVREGARWSDAGHADKGPGTTAGGDLLMPFPETAPILDAPPQGLDGSAPVSELGVSPDASELPADAGPVTDDGGNPQLLCMSNSDCASNANNPCCCPVLGISICLPLCPDPFCI